jgi:hypothetical protein
VRWIAMAADAAPGRLPAAGILAAVPWDGQGGSEHADEVARWDSWCRLLRRVHAQRVLQLCAQRFLRRTTPATMRVRAI